MTKVSEGSNKLTTWLYHDGNDYGNDHGADFLPTTMY